MNTIELYLSGGRVSNIYIGESIQNLFQYTGNRKTFIITDENVYALYHRQFPAHMQVIITNSGDENKTLSTIEKLVECFIKMGVDRESFIVGIGGGEICDITGFIASIYMRGVRFGFVATTLLAQVDASVGGKNGVNFQRYKNMLGVFNQPEFVLCDTASLETLPVRELHAGLGEVVKTALLGDEALFDYIESNVEEILALDKDVINNVIKHCINIKSAIVEEDEQEAGERRKLNLGHTFGHAIEKNSSLLLHGEAVSIGLVIAALISNKLNLLDDESVGRIIALLVAFELPIRTDIDERLLFDAITKDKKKYNNEIYFVLNDGIGDVKVQLIGFDELLALYASIQV